jgi:hypothetical protein
VKVKIIAINSVGSSAGSFDNSSGALVELVPHKPPTSPIKNASTTQSSLVVDYKHLEGTANGGSVITAYDI